jgi:hypothetical protein
VKHDQRAIFFDIVLEQQSLPSGGQLRSYGKEHGDDAIGHQQKAAKLGSDIMRLVTLDRIWTDYLNQAKSVPPHDVIPLARITGEMSELLLDISGVLLRGHSYCSPDLSFMRA